MTSPKTTRQVTVRKRREGESFTNARGEQQSVMLWLVVFTDTDQPLLFGGFPVYGGETKREAIEDAHRIAGKWDWAVVA